VDSVLERMSLDVIEDWIDGDLEQEARELLHAGSLRQAGYVQSEDIIWALFSVDGKTFRANFGLKGDQAYLGCDCDQDQDEGLCVHTIALLLAWIEMRDVFARVSSSEDPIAVIPPMPPAILEGANVPSPEQILENYRKLLESQTVPQMREMAAQRGVRLTGLRRDGILQALAEGLAQPDNLAGSFQRLSAPGRLVLALMNTIAKDTHRNALTSMMKVLDALLSENFPGQTALTSLRELTREGLLFLENGNHRLPLAVTFSKLQAPGLVVRYSGKIEKAGPLAGPGAHSFSRLALWLLLLGQAGALECLPEQRQVDYGGWPGSPSGKDRNRRDWPVSPFPCYLTLESQRRVAGITGLPAEMIDFTAALLDFAGLWAHGAPQKLQPVFTSWLQLSPGQQSRFLLQRARLFESAVELELARSSGEFQIKRDPYNSPSLRDLLRYLAGGRRLVFDLLALLAPGEWYDVEVLLRRLYLLTPDMLVIQAGARGVWLEDKGGRVNLSLYQAWRRTYGQVYLSVLTGPAAWLDICDLNWVDGIPAAFRLTEFGAYVLGVYDQVEQAGVPALSPSLGFTSGEVLEVDPVLATAEVISLVMLLGQVETGWAPSSEKKLSAGGSRLAYRLQTTGLGRAFEAGWTADRIRKVLQEAAQAQMPPALEKTIQGTWERYGRLHLYPDMALIQFADDYCLPELLTGTRLGQHLLYQFSPRLVAIRPDGVEPLLKELRERGYTPQVKGGPPG
jgi:hypothetical protein